MKRKKGEGGPVRLQKLITSAGRVQFDLMKFELLSLATNYIFFAKLKNCCNIIVQKVIYTSQLSPEWADCTGGEKKAISSSDCWMIDLHDMVTLLHRMPRLAV